MQKIITPKGETLVLLPLESSIVDASDIIEPIRCGPASLPAVTK